MMKIALEDFHCQMTWSNESGHIAIFYRKTEIQEKQITHPFFLYFFLII